MDPQELTRKLLEIAGVGKSIAITKRACWLDGSECPYGMPGGQFINRPVTFCRPNHPTSHGTNGCPRLNDHLDELKKPMAELLGDEIREGFSQKIEKATTKISSELKALADQTRNEPTKGVLKLAAELIEAGEDRLEDRKIVLLEDLDLEK